jgi:phosphate-selective porin OprO/OprP
VVHMTNNRPTICTVDEQSCISITSRIHWDVGGYDYHPNSSGTSPQKLDSGENLRRARIGVIGKFLGDWNYALIYDFAARPMASPAPAAPAPFRVSAAPPSAFFLEEPSPVLRTPF